jgi:hypothetical protein
MAGWADDNPPRSFTRTGTAAPVRQLHAYLSARTSQSAISGHMNKQVRAITWITM